MDELWKACIENYEISNTGRVRRKQLNGGYKEINGSVQNRGYRYFQLLRDGKRLNYFFHHLVAEHFIGDRPDGLVIDHIDRDKLNNRVENLRYISQKDNVFNADRIIAEIPQDTPNRNLAVCKKYRDTNKEAISTRKKERITCEACQKEVCRAWLSGHLKKCGRFQKSGRKKGDKSCINNLKLKVSVSS